MSKKRVNNVVTKDGGYIHGVFYSREQAINMVNMIKPHLEHMISTVWSNRLKDPSIAQYVGDLENKIGEGERIIELTESKK